MSNSKDPLLGYFSDGNYEHFFIKANPSGLRKHAADLNEIADALEKDSIDKVELKDKYDWVLGEIFIGHIEKGIDPKEFQISEVGSNETWKDKFLRLGCLTIILVILILSIVGGLTLIDLIIN
jgi:hypothetical protein